jgi:hypothetical protein
MKKVRRAEAVSDSARRMKYRIENYDYLAP